MLINTIIYLILINKKKKNYAFCYNFYVHIKFWILVVIKNNF